MGRILTERQISLTETNQQPKPIEQNSNRLAHLPQEWRWLSCDSFIVAIRGGTSAVPENDLDGVPVLRSSSVRELSIDFGDVRFLNPSHVKTVDDLEKGDLLFTRLNGNVDYVGNCAVVPELRERVQYPDRLFCAKMVNSIDSRFVAYYFASPMAKDIIRDIAKSSAGHQRIGIADIRGFAFPLPPLKEQKYLVSELDRLFSLSKHLEDTVLSKTDHVRKLRQSILQKAFSGHLVPQDPNDEPASALLERIRAEREAAGTKGKRGKKKTADDPQPRLLEVDA